MKASIEIEVENEEDAKQARQELEAALNHTTHLEDDVEVTGVNYGYADEKFPISKSSTIYEIMEDQREEHIKAFNDLIESDFDLEFRGISFIFTSDEVGVIESKVTDNDFDEEDYE